MPRKKRTTAADRSRNKGKGQSKVTGKTPTSRANRQKTSTAKVTRSGQGSGRGGGGRVTNASQRTSTGSARVTGTSRPALPPGKKGGPLAKTTTQTSRQAAARAKAARAARGSQGGTRVGQPAGSANRMYGANVVNKAVKRATRATRLAKGANVLKGAGRWGIRALLADQALKLLGRAADQKEWNRLSKELKTRQDKNKPSLPKGSGSRSGQGGRKPAAKPAKRPMANLPKDYKKTEAAAFKAAEKPRSGGGGSTRSSSGGGGSTTTRRAAAPAAPKPKKDRMVGKSSAERMAAWAKANRKMIEKSGTKAQKAILAKALKPAAPASKRGSTSPSSAVKAPKKGSPKPQAFKSLSERTKANQQKKKK